MTAHFINVLRQAFKTFDRANHNSFQANLQQLKLLTDELTYRDLDLKEELFRNAAIGNVGRAPCTYMHIFEDERFSMSLFIVRDSSSIPLHDHPMMYGLLRVIWGQLHIQSYSQQLEPHEPLTYEKHPSMVRVLAEPTCLATVESPTILLTPRKRNYHQITQSVTPGGNGVAAFFDILSPPYDANIPLYGPRRCRFYRPKILDGNEVQLQCIPSPLSYYCDMLDTPETILDCGFRCAAEACPGGGTDGGGGSGGTTAQGQGHASKIQ
ncbi:2-aminoethanethiol dioxygenase [Drosophila tropicalis]|uniref:2-aminoethanethiol dioxygenase n=1 Tax=Drosophila tropicalis TaxID=46794 RepID=UPI0035AC225F